MRENQAKTCPCCEGDALKLGTLGNLNWWRCRQCGCQFSSKARAARRKAATRK